MSSEHFIAATATPGEIEAIKTGQIPLLDDAPAHDEADDQGAISTAFEKAAAEPYAELIPVSPEKPANPGTLDKVASRIEDDPELASSIVYNVIQEAVYIRGPLPWDKSGRERRWTDNDDVRFEAYMQTIHGYESTEKNLRKGLSLFALAREYDPLKEVLDSLPKWDGTERVGHMLQWYLGVNQDGDPYGREVERLIYDAIVRRVYEPGCKFDYMPVLMGPQGIGKSTFLARLAIRDDLFTDNLPIFTDRDFPAMLQGRLVVEVSELSSMRRSDIEAVKVAVSSRTDTYREPYARTPIDRPRRCILVGTTNRARFLVDETGNRRFLPIACAAVEPTRDLFADDVQAEFEQALAEAVASYKAGRARKSLVLNGDARQAAAEAQAEAYLEDPRAELMEQWLETAPRRVCLTQICREALNMTGTISPWDLSSVRTLMDTRFSDEWVYAGKKKARIGKYGASRFYEKREDS